MQSPTASDSSSPCSKDSDSEQSRLIAYFCNANHVTGRKVMSRFTVTVSSPIFSSTASSSLERRALVERWEVDGGWEVVFSSLE